MVTKMRGAVLFPQEGRSEEVTPAQSSQMPPEVVKPKPTDRTAAVLPFTKSERSQVLFHPVDSVAFPPTPEIISIIIIFKDRQG